MIVGAIGYEVHSGLGHLMRDFFEQGVVDRVMVVTHPHYQKYNNWYPPDRRFTRSTTSRFLQDLDVLLVFENAFYWDVAARAKQQGSKFVVIPNYEYTPFPPKVEPDLFLCGSLLDVDYYQDRWPIAFLPIPVDTKRFPWRLRERAETFVHNAGHGQRGFAKGTPQIVEAMNHVKSPVKLILRMQPGERRTQEMQNALKGHPRIDIRFGEWNEDQLYSEGDVFLNAEQYNGMSLMLQEAHASGMLTMTTDRYPTNTWLPRDPLIPVERYEKDHIAVEFDRAVVRPEEIARKIDEWHGKDVAQLSLRGKEWAERHSWTTLKPSYMNILEGLL